MGIYGQDWASYQSDAPDTSGLAFFFTKITQGMGYENPRWPAQYAHGRSAGLVPGKYHYPNMGNSPAAEADYFLAHAHVQPGDMVALDWEGYDKANQGVPKSTQAAYKDVWLKYVKSKLPHNPVGMYCNTDYWRGVDHTGFYGDFLWIATGGVPAGQPGIQAPWLFHQYSTAGGIDRDYCHLASADALKAWVASFEETDMPMTPADAELFASHLLAKTVPNQFRKDAKGNPTPTPVESFLVYGDAHYDTLHAQLNAVTAQLGALSAAVAALAKGGSLTAAQVQAAAQAGAQAALAELGHALDGTPTA